MIIENYIPEVLNNLFRIVITMLGKKRISNCTKYAEVYLDRFVGSRSGKILAC